MRHGADLRRRRWQESRREPKMGGGHLILIGIHDDHFPPNQASTTVRALKWVGIYGEAGVAVDFFVQPRLPKYSTAFRLDAISPGPKYDQKNGDAEDNTTQLDCIQPD